MPCPSCGSSDLKTVVSESGGEWRMRRCLKCFAYPIFPLVTADPRLYGYSYFEAQKFPSSPTYSGYLSYDGRRALMRNDFYKLMKPFVRSGMKVLDIGCATGTALEAIRELGVAEENLCGVDISAYALERAENYLPRAKFIRDDILQSQINGRFDLILAADVIEHLSTPAELMRKISEWLQPRGLAIIITPDPDSWLRKISGAGWSEFRFKEHLCFVGRDWLENQARDNGLEIIKFSRPGKHVTLEHAFLRLKAYLPFLPHISWQFPIYLNTFDHWLAVLEKSSA